MKAKEAVLAAVFTLVIGGIEARDAFAAPRYNVTDAGDFRPLAMNDQGEAVGYTEHYAGTLEWIRHAVVWRNGVLTDLGTLAGISACAEDINNNGEIVGWYLKEKLGLPHAWVYREGAIIELDAVYGMTTSAAYAINDLGQIAGRVSLGGRWQACVWDTGGSHPHGTLGGDWCEPHAINENGEIVGWSYIANGWDIHPFLWKDGGMTDLIIGESSGSYAWDINNRGQVVGVSDQKAYYGLALLWQDGTTVTLGTLGGESSCALAVNDFSQVVGYARLPGSETHAFLWQNGVMHDLNNQVPSDLNWKLRTGVDINAAGQILCVGVAPYVERTLLLTPIVRPVTIDVIPKKLANVVNLQGKTLLPVALLTTPDFNAASADPSSIAFAGAAPVSWSSKDVDRDDDADLLLLFDPASLDLTTASTEADLTGWTLEREPFRGTDTIEVRSRR